MIQNLTDEELIKYHQTYKALIDKNKRLEGAKRFSFDVKFAYHVVRLLNEVEQILVEGDLDLEKNREQLKAIRRGEWSLEQIESYFETKEKALEMAYANSKLPHGPDEQKIKQLLLDCLETHYGSLSAVVAKNSTTAQLAREIQDVLDRYTK